MKKHTARRSRVLEFIRMNSSESEVHDEPLTTASAFPSIHEHPDMEDSQNLETLQQFNSMAIDLVWNDQVRMNFASNSYASLVA